MADNGDFTFANGSSAGNGLAKIQTHKKQNGICLDDSALPVKAQTLSELHFLQQKRSAPTSPIKEAQWGFSAQLSEQERQNQQLQSISASLASLTRETGPKVVRGDPSKKIEVSKSTNEIPSSAPSAKFTTSDSALKFTHVLHNLSPAG